MDLPQYVTAAEVQRVCAALKIRDWTQLTDGKVQPEEAGLRMSPKQEVELDPEHTVQVLKALETIEDLDDVQNVYSNLKVSDEALAALEA